MSRSFKRIPIIKDAPSSKRGTCVKKAKRYASKKVRRAHDISDGAEYKKLECSYNIHDNYSYSNSLSHFLK